MFHKYFTPQEATQTLPLVKKIVREILEKGKRLRGLIQNSQGEMTDECQTLEEEIDGLMGELEEIGCFYKDWNFEVGLVDFPAIIGNREIFLCWKSDEKELGWYHTIEDGFAGRKPIPPHWLINYN